MQVCCTDLWIMSHRALSTVVFPSVLEARENFSLILVRNGSVFHRASSTGVFYHA